MKTKKVEKVITTQKDRIRHLLKRHLTEIQTESTTLITFKKLYRWYEAGSQGSKQDSFLARLPYIT